MMGALADALGNRRVQLAGSVAGILGFFIAYGYLQEKIMSTRYGVEGERFTDSGARARVGVGRAAPS
jgi:hypothetical protein